MSPTILWRLMFKQYDSDSNPSIQCYNDMIEAAVRTYLEFSYVDALDNYFHLPNSSYLNFNASLFLNTF